MRLIDGTHHTFDLSDGRVQNHFNNPTSCADVIIKQFDGSSWEKYIKKGNVVLDIGANVGLFSLHTSPFASRLVCVEPTPEHCYIQEQLLRGIPNTREEAALSDHDGTDKFYWRDDNTTMNSLENRFCRSFDVKCITLPSLLDKHRLDHVDFCKIDIEGSEHRALTPSLVSKAASRIKRIFIELHPLVLGNLDYQSVCEKFSGIFTGAGYAVEQLSFDSLICTRTP